MHMLQQFYSSHYGTRTFFFFVNTFTHLTKECGTHTAVEIELSPPTDTVHSTTSCTCNHPPLFWPLGL